MKRAKLTPVGANPAIGRKKADVVGADLTDRLLEREGLKPAAPKPGAAASGSAPKTPARPAPKSARQKGAKSAATVPLTRRSPPAALRTRPMSQSQSDLVTATPQMGKASDLPEYTPYRTVEPRPPATPGPVPAVPERLVVPDEMPEALKAALLASEQAIAALIAAAAAAPARYDLALRYRLDSLAHHIRQVAEFISHHK